MASEFLIGGVPAVGTLVKDISTATFMAEVVDGSFEQPVIVDFWAPWCGPCKQLGPILEKVVRGARGTVRMVKLNIDENPEIAQQMRIQSIPAVYAFKEGRPVDGFVGALPEHQVIQFVQRLSGGHDSAVTATTSPEIRITVDQNVEQPGSLRERELESGRSHVFISYSNHDEVVAQKIVEAVEAAGFSCWNAKRDVPIGEDFQDAIVSAIEKCKSMILIFSTNANQSREVKKEIALASELNLLIIPVRIENVQPLGGFKYQLVTRQYLDYFVDKESCIRKLVDVLRSC